MNFFHFKHYILTSSHKHIPLLAPLILLAIANTSANSFALAYLIIKQGFSYTMCAVMVLIIASTATLVLMFALRRMMKNFEASIIASLIILSIYYLCFIMITGYLLILIAGILFGLYIPLFWAPYHSLLMHLTSKENRGATIGVYFLIFPAISIMFPAIGGEVIARFGYTFLFLSAFLILLLNASVVYHTKLILKIKIKPTVAELINSLKIKKRGLVHIDFDLKGISRRLRIALLSEGVQDGIFWVSIPLIGLEFAKNEVSLGRFFSLFACASAVMILFLGYLSDKIQDRKIFVKVGAIFTAVFCILASLSKDNISSFIIFMTLAYLSFPMIRSFLFAMIGDALEKEKKKGVVIREFFLNSGRAIGALLCIIVILTFGDMNLRYALLFSGFFISLIFFVK